MRFKTIALNWLNRRREDEICLAIVLLTALLSLSPVLFFHRIPVDTSPLANFPPWESAFDGPGSTTLSPALRYHLPNYLFIANENLNDRGLLWDPLEYGGMPFFGAWRTRCISPFTAPFYLFSFAIAIRVSLVLKLLVAGCVAFIAARRLGLTAPFSLMAALAFQLSANLTLYPLSPSSDVLVWFPLFFVFLERLALGHLAHWATGAATIGLMILGGSPEMLSGVLLLGLVYLSVRLALRRDRIRPGPPLATYGATVLIAGVLTAIQVLPFVEFRANVVLMEPLRDNPPMAVIHLGLVNVLLAGVWLSMRQHISTMPRRRVDCTIIVSAIMVAFVLATGPVFRALPTWLQIEPHQLIGGTIFILSIGAGATSEAWLELNPRQCRMVLKRLVIVAPLLILPAVLVSLLPFEAPNFSVPEEGQLIFTGSLCAIFTVVFGITLVRPSVRLMGYGMAALTAIELAVSFYPLRVYSPMNSVYPETRTITELRESGLVSGGPVLARWPLAGNGIRQVYGTGPYEPRSYLEWQSEADLSSVGAAPSPMLFFGAQGVRNRLANVRHELQLAEVYPEGVARYRYEDAPPEIEFVPKKTEGDNSITSPADRHPTLDVVQNYHSRLKVRTSSQTGENLNVWKTTFPGWIAEVDGMPAGLRTIHGPYRSVALPPGDHVVNIRYRPLYYATGVWLSVMALLVLAFGYFQLWRQRVSLRKSAVRLI